MNKVINDMQAEYLDEDSLNNADLETAEEFIKDDFYDQDEDDKESGNERHKRGSNARRAPRTVAELEEEGDIAADYLEELLDIVDFGGDIDIDVENNRALVEIIAEGEDQRDLNRLVGRDGEVLEALQELTRLAVQARTGERSRLMLDIAGFRASRRDELTNMANEAITKVETTGEPVKLPPMNPFERKVCHDVIAAAGFISESEGQDSNRCVVVFPADSGYED